MSTQNSVIKPSKLLTLYFNTSDASGFEVCEEISKSEENSQSEEKIIIYRPINKDDGEIYNKISDQGKDYQIKHIKLYNQICTMLDKEQNKNQNDSEQQNEGDFFDQFEKNEDVNSLIQQNKQYPSESEVIFRQQLNKQIFKFEQVQDNSVTFCLLYDDQKLSEIDSEIDRFKTIFPKEERKPNIVIVINGKEKFKFSEDVQLKENIKENKCNICYSYEYKECIFLVIIEEQSTIRLLKWIYRGIFKLFQSEYFYIGSLSIHIDIEKFRNMDRMMRSPNYCGATGYYNLIHQQNESKIINLNYSFVGYMNFLNYQFQIDSLSQLKRFHNPFFSYYKWNECYSYFDNYIKKLEKENFNLHLNTILPSIMFEQQNEKQFFSASSNLGEKKIIQDNQAQMFLELSNMMYHMTQCNNYALNKQSLVYTLLLELRQFDSKVKLAQILFLYTFSPYQGYFYLNISRSYIKIIISIICPFFLFILLLLFVLLVQQYQIGVTIVKKKIINLEFFLIGKVLHIVFKSQPKIFKDISEDSKTITIENNNKQYIFEQLNKQLPKHYFEEQISNVQNSHVRRSSTEDNINSQQLRLMHQEEEKISSQNSNSVEIYKVFTQSRSEKKVDIFYERLFLATYVVEICCSLIVILNLIYTYGRNLIYDIQNYQHFVTIIGIIIFIFIFIFRNGIKKDQFWVSLLVPIQIFFNLLITTVYSEMYHLLRIRIKPKEYLEQVQKLSQYLCLNILFLIIFYIVETSMNFEGYIFSIIIFYNLTLYLLDSLFVFGAKLKGCFNQSISSDFPKKECIRKQEEVSLSLLKNYQAIVSKNINDLRKKPQDQNEKKPDPKGNNASIQSQNRSHQDLIPPKEDYTNHDAAKLNDSQSSELDYK